MEQTKLLMGMPITVEIIDSFGEKSAIEKVFDYFKSVDQRFSTYKKESEISQINQGKLPLADWTGAMQEVFALCEKTRRETNGYFNILHRGKYDPSGLVKGWAIYHAAQMLKNLGFTNFYVEAGGDIQVSGCNAEGKKWRVGIRNPFNRFENVKIIHLDHEGVATSGTYIRGQHVYNPHQLSGKIKDIVSLTVIGPNVYEADRFATAAFAMGKKGIEFVEKMNGFEGYMVDAKGVATLTSNFEKYVG